MEIFLLWSQSKFFFTYLTSYFLLIELIILYSGNISERWKYSFSICLKCSLILSLWLADILSNRSLKTIIFINHVFDCISFSLNMKQFTLALHSLIFTIGDLYAIRNIPCLIHLLLNIWFSQVCIYCWLLVIIYQYIAY